MTDFRVENKSGGGGNVSTSPGEIPVPDHSIVRYDGTTGLLIESSPTFIGYDDGTISNPTADANSERFGIHALSSITTGKKNSAFGGSALLSAASGTANDAFGFEALKLNIAGFNSAFGMRSLSSNTTGIQNVAVGSGFTLSNNVDGSRNIAIGYQAMNGNFSGNDCVGIGWQALAANTTSNNTAVGSTAMSANTTGGANVAVGWGSMLININGSYCVGIGVNALYTNNADQNVAIGYQTLGLTTSGHHNTAVGSAAMTSNDSGSYNAAIGEQAGYNNHGSYSTFLGAEADAQSSHDYCAAIGYLAKVNEDHTMVFGDYTDTAFHTIIGATQSGLGSVHSKFHVYVASGDGYNDFGIYSENPTYTAIKGKSTTGVAVNGEGHSGALFTGDYNGYGVIGQVGAGAAGGAGVGVQGASTATGGIGVYGIGASNSIAMQAEQTGGLIAFNIKGGSMASNGTEGTSGQVWTSQGTGAIPVWATPSTPGASGGDGDIQFATGGAFDSASALNWNDGAPQLLVVGGNTKLGASNANYVDFVAGSGASAPGTSLGVGIVNYYGANATNFLGDPNAWIDIKINGSAYKLPAY